MSDFIPGQRWNSDGENELGLGIIQEVTNRTVSVFFPAAEETRIYSKTQAPLNRISFSVGDSIEDNQQHTFKVISLSEKDGIITYEVTDDSNEVSVLQESELSASIKLNRAKDRLFSNQVDPERAYILRYDTLKQTMKLATSDVQGLYGPRISLIPHQLYIAHEVSHRPAPRVLLADEVGLGKTIEAGLILHHQLVSGRAQRVLIIVPDALLHQWLVEMLRRFNLKFSLYNEQRCEALISETENPFDAEQLVLCSIDFLVANPHRHEQIINADWDLLVVDEAHHLLWSQQSASAEYQLVENISANTPGLLLLTATPEQLGLTSHFARLRLLDPHRFYDLNEFINEEQHYTELAKAAEVLIDGHNVTDSDINKLAKFLADDYHHFLEQLKSCPPHEQAGLHDKILDQLIDQHGTGRVLFRNTRHAIKGFPQRKLNAYALNYCKAYYQLFSEIFTDTKKKQLFSEEFGHSYAELMQTPEIVYKTLQGLEVKSLAHAPHWTSIDPRFDWLARTLSSLKNKKILVICAHAHTALELEAELRNKFALRASVFHEDMSIVERDRAAAYFADFDDGAQILICSEIGSEGRNFQFAHHLILFDLPCNPDLLEQRIGRLDRIGQTETIQIHVPYIKESPQEALFHWYNEGLNAFNQTCPAGQGMLEKFAPRLNGMLENEQYDVQQVIDFLDDVKPVYDELNLKMQQGRDRLLELNAFRKPVADKLIIAIDSIEHNSILEDYMNRVCDTFGVDFSEHSAHSYIIKPGNHMLIPHFPELPDDGAVVTFARDIALVHEDRMFLSWEHPMIIGAMDMVFEGEYGNVALSIIKNKLLKTGSVLLEMLFVIQCIAPKHLQVNRFLPPQTIRLVMDAEGNDYSQQLDFEHCHSLVPEIDKVTSQQVINAHKNSLRHIIQRAETGIEAMLPDVVIQAQENVQNVLGEQLSRLIILKKHNPSVRDDEISYLENQVNALNDYLVNPQIRLDAVRMIIAG